MIKKFYSSLRNRFEYTKNLLSNDNRGMGTLELVLIIIVILGILVIFRDNIESLINTVFTKIQTQVNSFA